MAIYIALLRAVNIGGNVLKMERLRALCPELGFKNVRTYVQSGNMIFEAEGTSKTCRNELEKKLLGETRLPVDVMVRTPTELKKVLSRNPFVVAAKPPAGTQDSTEPVKLYVAFLASAPTKAAIKKLEGIKTGQDEFHVSGKEIYLHYASGYGNSKMTNNLFEKVLSTRATTRNWNTVNKLYELATA